jgi:hypothetical protein
VCMRELAEFVKYEACPGSKDTKVLNMYNIFNLQKRHYPLDFHLLR